MTQRPLLLPAADVRAATVLAHGCGQRSQVLIVRVDDSPAAIEVLGPPRDMPAPESRVALRLMPFGWQLAGGAP